MLRVEHAHEALSCRSIEVARSPRGSPPSRSSSGIVPSTIGGTTVATKRPSFASTVILKLAVGDIIALGLTKHDEFTVTPQPGNGATLTIVPLN